MVKALQLVNGIPTSVEVSSGAPGDISATNFSLSNNQTASNVTGLLFSSSTSRMALIKIHYELDATADKSASFELVAHYDSTDSTWKLFGDFSSDQSDLGVSFDITAGGQVIYDTDNIAGFVSATIRFEAKTLEDV